VLSVIGTFCSDVVTMLAFLRLSISLVGIVEDSNRGVSVVVTVTSSISVWVGTVGDLVL
jgi:hypothetical protein